MKINKILVILGEPNSTFSEILFKYFKSQEFYKNKKKIILIGNLSLLQKQMGILKVKLKVKLKRINNIEEAKTKDLNIINIKLNNKKNFSKISSNSSKYITNSFKLALDLIKNNQNIALINGPISKKHFLKKKYLGITEYIIKKNKFRKNLLC
jgi:Pyridoxal phosphate biosynthesis protein